MNDITSNIFTAMFLVLNHCFQQVEEYNGDAITFWWVLYIDRSSCRLYSFDLSAKAAPKRDSAGTAFDLVFFFLGLRFATSIVIRQTCRAVLAVMGLRGLARSPFSSQT